MCAIFFQNKTYFYISKNNYQIYDMVILVIFLCSFISNCWDLIFLINIKVITKKPPNFAHKLKIFEIKMDFLLINNVFYEVEISIFIVFLMTN